MRSDELWLDAPAPAREAPRVEAIDEYFTAVTKDLEQLYKLVGQAVEDLVVRAVHIGSLSRSQREVASAMADAAHAAASAELSELVAKQAELGGSLDRHVMAVVTSLQFGDLAQQLLGHIAKRVSALAEALQRIEQAERGCTCAAGDSASRAKALTSAVDSARSGLASKPVVQQGMQSGDVELF
jgi:hypothetical protein